MELIGTEFPDAIIIIIQRFFKGFTIFRKFKKKLSFSEFNFTGLFKLPSCDYDSHLLRKYGIEKASKIKVKASIIKKIKIQKKWLISIDKLDYYLKFLI